MTHPTLTGLLSVCLAAASALQVANEQPNQLQEKATQQTKQKDRASQISEKANDDREQKDRQQATTENQRTEIPEFLQQLDLNDQQKQEILAIYQDSDQKAEDVWTRVQKLHRQAISMEAAVIAAARLEGHDHKAHATQSGQATPDQSGKPAAANRQANFSQSDPSADPATAEQRDKPANRAARSGIQKDQNTANNRNPDPSRQTPGSADQTGQTADLNIVAVRVGIAQPDGRVREYFLAQPVSQDDNSATSQACREHQEQLMKVWKDIHQGHEQLVELEADTIVRVEATLTEQQLEKLDKTTTEAAASDKSPNDSSRR